jgi:histidyl-tRNA synthetase
LWVENNFVYFVVEFNIQKKKMAIQKPGIPKGTRDFGPAEMSRRNHVFSVIKEVFQQHGYAQIETPAMENLDTLLGKYGEEGDKLLFKILNSGDFLAGADNAVAARNLRRSPQYIRKGYVMILPCLLLHVVQHQHGVSSLGVPRSSLYGAISPERLP